METIQKVYKTPRKSEGTKQRRTERAAGLAKRFSRIRSIENIVFKDEKDFTKVSRLIIRAAKFTERDQLSARFIKRTDSLQK